MTPSNDPVVYFPVEVEKELPPMGIDMIAELKEGSKIFCQRIGDKEWVFSVSGFPVSIPKIWYKPIPLSTLIEEQGKGMQWVKASDRLPPIDHQKTFHLRFNGGGWNNCQEVGRYIAGRFIGDGRGSVEDEYVEWLDESSPSQSSTVRALREALEEPIPDWVIQYNKAGHRSSAGQAIRILLDRIEKITALTQSNNQTKN